VQRCLVVQVTVARLRQRQPGRTPAVAAAAEGLLLLLLLPRASRHVSFGFGLWGFLIFLLKQIKEKKEKKNENPGSLTASPSFSLPPTHGLSVHLINLMSFFIFSTLKWTKKIDNFFVLVLTLKKNKKKE
jgi:hypothetical protein